MYGMKWYSVAAVRERLADALDEAERGVPVVIERKGVRYRLTLETAPRRRKATRSRIEIVDPAVAGGDWTWAQTGKGLAFKKRRP
jgi:hypothetical protein